MNLPKFIIDKIKAKNTSLGDNLALPPEEDYAFEYILIKKRFNELCGMFTQHFHNLDINQTDEIISLLNEKMTQCQQLESSVRPQLEKLCENKVINLLQVPAETVIFECHLVDHIQPKHDLNVMPESASNRDFDFNDLTDYENVNKVILKRRFLNTLIQGAAHYYALFDEELLEGVKEINPKLNLLYFEIGILNELLLYTKEEKISDTHKPQGACVEVEVNGNDEKTSIYVQGKLFPFLLQESLRGFYELFASHGLPQDNKKANYILRQSDFLLAEPWDMRIGIPMWKHLINDDLTPQISPYFFMMISCTPVDEFNAKMREMLAKTKVGKDYFQTLKNEALHDYEMNSMIAIINLKNDEENLLNDSYMSAEDLDDEMLEEDFLTEQELDNMNVGDEEELKDLLISSPKEDFQVEIGSSYGPRLYLVNLFCQGIEIPKSLINLRVERVDIDNITLCQLHIHIDPSIRGNKLTYKTYYAFIKEYGAIVSFLFNRAELAYQDLGAEPQDDPIEYTLEKLGREPNIILEPLSNMGDIMGYLLYWEDDAMGDSKEIKKF